MNGRLVPLGGGDPIPLLKERILIGRRPDCDIRLAFPNVSNKHCELCFDRGSWLIRDLNSANGVKINGHKVKQKRLVPGDHVAIARKHLFRIEYVLEAAEMPRDDVQEEDVMKQSLLERAGLARRPQVDEDSDLEDLPQFETMEYEIDPETGRKRWKI